MRTVVCLKHVPKNNNNIKSASGIINRGEVSGMINPYDKIAIEFALKYTGDKDELIALSMGPPEAEQSLREAIAYGADRGVLLSDKNFAEADTLATSYVLSKGIQKIGEVDLIICGERTIDSDTGHVGPQLAELLDVPLLTYVTTFEIQDNIVIAERICDNLQQTLNADIPALLTINHKLTENIYPSMAAILKAHSQGDVSIWNAEDIDADFNKIGRNGSATYVNRVFTPEKDRIATMIKDSSAENAVNELLKLLIEKKILLMDKHDRGKNLG